MHRLAAATLLLALAGCAPALGATGPVGPGDPAAPPAATDVTVTPVDAPLVGGDTAGSEGFAPQTESSWAHPRLHVDRPTVPGARAFDDAVAARVARTVAEYRASAGPRPGVAMPELSVTWASIANGDGVVGARVSGNEFLGADTGRSVWSVYGTRDGRSAWTGPDLVRPQDRDRVVDLAVRAAERDSLRPTGEERPSADALLADAEVTRAGALQLVVGRGELAGADAGQVAVTLAPAVADQVLSDAGRRVRAAVAASPRPATSTARPAGTQDAGAPVDCAVARCVALTFDDGPGPYTGRILDTLAARRAVATFFVVGRNVEAMPDVVRRERALGMAVGDHTWTHRDLAHLDAASATAEISRTASAVWDATGEPPFAVRPPYGSFTRSTPHADLPFVLWDVDTQDWKNRDAAVTTRRVLDGVHPGAIVLMHDVQPSTAAALGGLVDALRDRGYTLVTVPQLLGDLDPARAYFSRTSSR